MKKVRMSPMPLGISMGALASTGMTVLGSAGIAWMMLGEKIPEQNLGYWIMALLFLASLLGAWMAVRKVKYSRLLVCGLTGAVYYGLLLGITALFFGGQYRGCGATALMILAGSGCMALLGLRQPKQKRIRIRRR